jgi:anti-anti-sigma factor
MKLTPKKLGKELYIGIEGRLDASWADYFTEALLEHIRNGEHKIVIDTADLAFISSAGIRSLLKIHQKLQTVQGGFRIIRASEPVWNTLETAGFGSWLNNQTEIPSPDTAGLSSETENYVLDENSSLTLKRIDAWQPWQEVNGEQVEKIAFTREINGLGIGCAAPNYPSAKDGLGEFVAFCGHLAMQPPSERSKPDYLNGKLQFVPELCCIQALLCQGAMSHLFRFATDVEHLVYPLSELLVQMLDNSGNSEALGFVIIGEIDGLVGASLINSPGELNGNENIAFPEIRNWLRFSGERVFPGEQALISGVVSRNREYAATLPQLESQPGLFAHIHAAVFPYHPLPNGNIALQETIYHFFEESSPRGVMHLLDDRREFNGLGESSLIRGACWYGRINNPEVLK